MKNFCTGLLIGLALLAMAGADPAPKKDDLGELLGKLEAVSPRLTKAQYTIIHIEFDRLGPGTIFTLKRSFQQGNKYKVVGVGGKGILDLHLNLLDAKGKSIATDQGTDSVSIVNVVPKANASYTLKVSAAKLDPKADAAARPYFFCLIASKPK